MKALILSSVSRCPSPRIAGAAQPASAPRVHAHTSARKALCSIDAFTFRGEHRVELRPAVEWNARFTMGTLLAGLVRRARHVIEAQLPAPPGETRRLEFALAAPDAGWPSSAPAQRLWIPLAAPDALAPALLLSREAEPTADPS